MKGIVDVCRRKLGRMASRGFMKVGMMSQVNPSDGRGVYYNFGRDLMCRLTCIKKGEDVVALCKGKRLHDDGSKEEVVVMIYLLWFNA